MDHRYPEATVIEYQVVYPVELVVLEVQERRVADHLRHLAPTVA